MVFAGIIIINLWLADTVVQNILLRPIPSSPDIMQEVIALVGNIAGSIIILLFLGYETSKVYNFLLKSEKD